MKLSLAIIQDLIVLSTYIFYTILLSRLWVIASDYIKHKKQLAQDTSPQLAKNITIGILIILLILSFITEVVKVDRLRDELHEAKIQKQKCEEHLNDVLFLVRYTNNKLNREKAKEANKNVSIHSY